MGQECHIGSIAAYGRPSAKTFPDSASAQAGAWLIVSLPDIADNYGLVVGLGAGTECAGVVKANACGLGIADMQERSVFEGLTCNWR